MKKLFLLAVLLLLLIPGALSEESAGALLDKAGFAELEALSEALDGPNVREIAGMALSGKLPVSRDIPAQALRQLLESVRSALLPALSALVFPVLVTLALGMVLGADSGPLTLLCRLATAYSLARQYAGALALARQGMAVAVRIANTAAPVVAAALALTGRAASAATLTPLSAICADGIENALVAWGLPLSGIAAIVAAGGSLSDRFRLDRLFRLMCRAITWSVGMLIAAFVGLMALQGRLAATRDGATNQAMRQALRGMIPFIGGSVADSSGALMETALALRNAVGVAVKTTDTIVEVDQQGCIVATPPRSSLRNMQTPQCFRLGVIRKAYEVALRDPAFVTTDDCGVVAKYLPEEPVFIVEGEPTNIKVTYKEDLALMRQHVSF